MFNHPSRRCQTQILTENHLSIQLNPFHTLSNAFLVWMATQGHLFHARLNTPQRRNCQKSAFSKYKMRPHKHAGLGLWSIRSLGGATREKNNWIESTDCFIKSSNTRVFLSGSSKSHKIINVYRWTVYAHWTTSERPTVKGWITLQSHAKLHVLA